jgi:hypothetical protein
MPTAGRAILNVKDSLLAGERNVPETAPELDLERWESRSDGLIFFDLEGNFKGCSAKLQRVAGSIDAAREVLAGCSWPRTFAASGEPISIFRQVMLFGGKPGDVEVRCVRTRGGFVAAIALAPPFEPGVKDLLLDIFSAHIVERRAISRHLHSALTQDLVALSLSLSAMREEGGPGLSDAVAYVERCCRGVRALSYVLAPPSFLNSDLMETLAWYAGVLRADAGVDFEVVANELPEDLPEEIKSLFFAALQHMAAAAIWHPHGAKIRVRLHASGEQLSMNVDCACQPDEPVAESPLIRERARALGGSMRLMVNREAATLEISVPWSAAE